MTALLEQAPPPPRRDRVGVRIKARLLGRPLHSKDVHEERLGKPTALAVFASDNLSSSAYATEEILHVLVPAVGIAAFSLVMPVTFTMLVVLGFLILSYRQTIKAYPVAAGAYVVTRDNFGDTPAAVAAAALLIDYILTVAVSVSAGTSAITSAFHSLEPYRVFIAIAFIGLIGYGNLRGVRESGRIFATPTYFFMVNMALLLGLGLFKYTVGTLPRLTEHPEGVVHFGSSGDGVLLGATVFIMLKAFASAGTAVTGVEAISDGVSAFRRPEWRNARTTLTMMGTCLGVMFVGLSLMASKMHVAPYEHGNPTVISEIGRLTYGGGLGTVLFYSLQLGTTLILVLAANTSFADFPRMVSIAAADGFMPRYFTKRGHRLVFSNGIIALGIAAAVVVALTGAVVTRLIPLYAVGVFLCFTLSQAGMTRRQLRLKEPGWRRGTFINGFGALMTAVVCLVFVVVRFNFPGVGSWVIAVAIPIIMFGLLRTHRAYGREVGELELDIRETFKPPRPRHRVVVLVGKLDKATLEALQYGRQLRPLSIVALHVAVDPVRAQELQDVWSRVGVPIELIVLDAPHRDLVGGVEEFVGELSVQPGTEVTVLMPARRYSRPWHRLLHDVDSRLVTRALSRMDNVNLTVVPFRLLARGRPDLEAVP